MVLEKAEQEKLNNDLLDAAESRNTEEVLALLTRGAEPNRDDHPAPLFWAVKNGNVKMT